jgi:filamentous hemagglutinin family protein
MKTSLFPLAGLLPAFLLAPLTLHAQLPGVPVLSTPGTATWTTQVTDSGNRLIFSFTGSSILDWSSGFNLSQGSEVVFNFVNSGDTVVNMLGGTGMNTIAGTVTSNGNIAFFSPNADLQITGSVTGNSVTVATLDVDTTAFLGGGRYTFTGNPASFNGLEVSGSIRATGGDVVLAGRRIDVTREGGIHASGAARLAAGTHIEVNPSAVGRKMKVKGDEGFVLNLGETRAGRIEIAAGSEITNKGRLDTAAGRIFLEVGNNGKVIKDRGIMVGNVSINGRVDHNASIKPNEGDSASALSPSTLKIPAVRRPDGSAVLASRTVANSTPISASADSARDRKGKVSQVASRDKKPMLQRASFFGMRGGSTAVKK